MPSNRRFKSVATIVGVLFLAFLYFSGSTTQSDKDFYESSVAGMAARAKAKAGGILNPEAKESPRIPPPAPGADDSGYVKENSFAPDHIANGRRPPQVALADDDGSKRVKDSEGYIDPDKEKPAAKPEKTDEEHEVEAELNSILKRSPIIIFSKSYCPFSRKAKNIFGLYSITPAPFIVELDQHKLMTPLQDQLKKLTGRRTVPNILVSGTSIGGGDEVGALHEEGGLIKKIKDLAGKRIMEARLKGIKEKD